MRNYSTSGFGCVFLFLMVLLVIIFVLRLFGTLVLGVISNPVLLVIILLLLFLSRSSFHKKEEKKPDTPVDYEFIDEEDSDS